MNNIVIIGAGFAGLRCAIQLEKLIKKAGLINDWNIILVDKNSYHTYTPALYEAASAYIWTGSGRGEKQHFEEMLGGSMCISIGSIIKGKKIVFIHQGISSIDFSAGTVHTELGGKISYEFLVLALGSESMFFGIKGADSCCLSLKTLYDALRVRRRMEEIFRKYKNNKEGSAGKIELVVVGGGATGVEIIGEVAKYARRLAKDFKIKKSAVRLSLLEANDQILMEYPNKQRRAVVRRLTKIGVKIKTSSRINEVENKCVVLDEGEKCPSSMTIWAAGIKAPKIFDDIDMLQTGKRGRIAVNHLLQTSAGENTFAIGDNSLFIDKVSGKSAPATAHVALAQADIVAKNILNSISDSNASMKRYRIDMPGYILSCGGKYAVANLWGINISGILGWTLKRIVDFKYFLSILSVKSTLVVWVEEIRLFTKND